MDDTQSPDARKHTSLSVHDVEGSHDAIVIAYGMFTFYGIFIGIGIGWLVWS